MRETSLEAFRQLKEGGDLGKRQLQIAELYANADGPKTDREIETKISRTEMPNNAINTRISELIRLGVLVECGKRRCTISGRNARTADLAAHKPVPLQKVPATFFWVGLDETSQPIAIRKDPDRPLGFDDGRLIKVRQVVR